MEVLEPIYLEEFICVPLSFQCAEGVYVKI